MSIVEPFVKVLTQRESRRQLRFANDASCIIHINTEVAWVHPNWSVHIGN